MKDDTPESLLEKIRLAIHPVLVVDVEDVESAACAGGFLEHFKVREDAKVCPMNESLAVLCGIPWPLPSPITLVEASDALMDRLAEMTRRHIEAETPEVAEYIQDVLKKAGEMGVGEG